MPQRGCSDAGYETFAEMTLPLQSDLRRYCLAKAGSSWDADDLLQESLIKAYRWHTRFPNREITKPFLFRIAANAWVDICRSRKLQPQVGQLEASLNGSYEEWSGWDVREALELLSDRLEPKQVVLILLIDVFHFTAKETGVLFGQSEGSVKAALKRARTRLKTAVERHPEYWDDAVMTAPRRGLSLEVFEALVDGFRRADPYAIFRSYQSMIDDGAVVDRIEWHGNTLYFTIIDPDGNVLTITEKLRRQDGQNPSRIEE
ncbi:RNA polymerase sigma factor [Cohnella lubricantis]|uniref:RNA polymerase sigma factor n=1 Tax=Cohnella lubricantis TaxID=2163172 RepID=A0A841TBN6_9BACL|nr:RNA polymerase sigma factor [Cohnella lubricantis]MBB6676788.1 RNA polymerase sigma factor [Cohnella lubricantis]MBP2118124.1 RNA polymerase sigma-70 factor (ECF subfamily) [Cohnella lubricantis]